MQGGVANSDPVRLEGWLLCNSHTAAMVGPAQQQHGVVLARMQQCVHSLLASIQEDPSRQGLLDTPKVSQCGVC